MSNTLSAKAIAHIRPSFSIIPIEKRKMTAAGAVLVKGKGKIKMQVRISSRI